MAVQKKTITEDDKVYIKWFAEARTQTLETLPVFLKKLSTEYDHTNITKCHVIAASAMAASCAAMSELNMGHTKMETTFIMWDFIKNWQYGGEDLPLKIFNYEQMLYPHFSDKFEKEISDETWQWIQSHAEKLLKENPNAASKIIKHWNSIINGIVPFGYKIKEKQ